ncbi:hypothetical protein AB6A40_003949 [Gnathostoma spinigerum]|uniref:Uncharacterized protein n=1 Tax=Gnathostoma spinigerum TaxID=75299 RepID=A0ABD6EB23_9BILA
MVNHDLLFLGGQTPVYWILNPESNQYELTPKAPQQANPSSPLMFVQPIIFTEREYYSLPKTIIEILTRNSILERNPTKRQYILSPEGLLALPAVEIEKLRREDLSRVPQLKNFIGRMPMYSPMQPGMPGMPGYFPMHSPGQTPYPGYGYPHLPKVVLSRPQYNDLPQPARRVVDRNNMFDLNPRTDEYELNPARFFNTPLSDLDILCSQNLSNAPRFQDFIARLPLFFPMRFGMRNCGIGFNTKVRDAPPPTPQPQPLPNLVFRRQGEYF